MDVINIYIDAQVLCAATPPDPNLTSFKFESVDTGTLTYYYSQEMYDVLVDTFKLNPVIIVPDWFTGGKALGQIQMESDVDIVLGSINTKPEIVFDHVTVTKPDGYVVVVPYLASHVIDEMELDRERNVPNMGIAVYNTRELAIFEGRVRSNAYLIDADIEAIRLFTHNFGIIKIKNMVMRTRELEELDDRLKVTDDYFSNLGPFLENQA